MGFTEALGKAEESRNQRWAHYFTLLFLLVGLVIGYNLRTGTLFATRLYINTETGIRAEYPLDWLIDTDGDYVFRVRDMARLGFKTTIQVEIFPFAPGMSPRNVFDDLALARAQTLSNYRTLDIQTVVLPSGETVTINEYTFVFTDPNPFLQAIPVVVIGRDVMFIRRGQAILMSFFADSSTYANDLQIFDNFLSSLDF